MPFWAAALRRPELGGGVGGGFSQLGLGLRSSRQCVVEILVAPRRR